MGKWYSERITYGAEDGFSFGLGGGRMCDEWERGDERGGASGYGCGSGVRPIRLSGLSLLCYPPAQCSGRGTLLYTGNGA